MISIIVAIAKNGIIGGENALLWHIPEDLQRFKRLTTGHPVVMGRKTFESLGRPLPNRTNVVITRQQDYKAEGCVVVHSLAEAIEMFPPEEEVFIIGGGEIYNQAWNIADKLYITWIHANYKGDTYFPDNYLKALYGVNKLLIKPEDAQFIGRAYKRRNSIYYQWQVTRRESLLNANGISLEFIDYERVGAELPMFDVQIEVNIKTKRK